jgi:hypothetical protein
MAPGFPDDQRSGFPKIQSSKVVFRALILESLRDT